MSSLHRSPLGSSSLLVTVLCALLPAVGCSVVKSDQPVEQTPQACCTEADPQLQHFQGCRVARRSCHKDERWWIRGYVTCTAVDEANCAGGRCCEYRPQYDPAAGQPPAETPAAAAEPDEPAPAPEPAPAAEPTPAADAPPAAVAPAPAEADGDDPEAPLP
jgi:hypothetical protein